MVQLLNITIIIGIMLTCVLAKKEFYSDRYDYIDAKAILVNDTLRMEYYNCFMDIKPCEKPEIKFFKGIVNEAITTRCRKCTEKQKQMLEIVFEWYSKNNLDEWNCLLKKILTDLTGKNF